MDPYGCTKRDGVITIRVPEVWVLFDQNHAAIGIMRGDTHLDVTNAEDAHRLFAKGRQLAHERNIGFAVEGMASEAGHALMLASTDV